MQEEKQKEISQTEINNRNPLSHLLQEQGFVILDGGLASELERSGGNIQNDLWSSCLLVDNPDLIHQVHYRFYEAGADVAISCSYQASFEGFARRGLSEEQTEDLLRRSVQIACNARDEFWQNNHSIRIHKPIVAASIGPYAAFLADGSEYQPTYNLSKSVQDLMNWHRKRFRVLLESGADIIACETIPCIIEVEALVRLIIESNTNLQAWISVCCQDADNLNSGESLVECVQRIEMLDPTYQHIFAIGINCTAPNHILKAIQNIRQHTNRQIVVYPNSGEEWDAVNKQWKSVEGNIREIENYSNLALQWFQIGSSKLIGGCCRTTPQHITVLRNKLSEVILSK